MTHVDEDEHLERCYRHPNRETALHCLNCERPICVDCAIAAPVGFKCPECGKQSRAALARVPRHKLLSGLAVALVASVIGGFAYALLSLPFIGWILSMFVGGLIAELAVRASGGYRDPQMASMVAGIVFVGWSMPYILELLGTPVLVGGSPFTLVAAAFAAFGAVNRSR